MRKIENFCELLYTSAKLYCEKKAFIFKDNNGKICSVSYNEFKNDVESLGKILLKKGYKGKHIALCCKNCYEWCVVYFAVTCFVGVVVPLDKELPEEEIENILNFSQCDVIFGDNLTLKKIKDENILKINIDTGIINHCSNFSDMLSEGKTLDMELKEQKQKDELSILLFTSGTTGMTKGVMLSQKNICSDMVSVVSKVEITKDDVSLSVLPLHHAYECIAFLMVIYCGGTIAFSKSIRTLREDFASFRPTVFVCVPLILEKLYAAILKRMQETGKRRQAQLVSKMAPLMSREHRKKAFWAIHSFFGGRLNKIIVGAAALDEKIAGDFVAFGFDVIIGYGLTECSPIVICNDVRTPTVNSIGKPLDSAEVKIIDKDEEGIGELCVKGPMVMLGYYKNPEATGKAVKNGWFMTGDLGFADKNGYYHITGRKKNVIVTKNGKNIYPEELEHYLLRNPVIKEVVVSSERGDIITAHILPDTEQILLRHRENELTASDIKKAVTEAVRTVNKKVPSYKNIRDIIIRDKEFNKTTTHKIKRTPENGNPQSLI